MKTTGHASAHLGHGKTTNEDAHLVDLTLGPEIGLYVVCDGATHAYGNLASATTCREIQKGVHAQRQTFQAYLTDPSPANRQAAMSALSRAVLEAGNALYKIVQGDSSKKGMFTTVEAVVTVGDYALLAHIGDSRTYLLREGSLHRLTADHTYFAEMVAEGSLTPEEAKRRPFANDLTRALGIAPYIQLDSLQLELSPGDLLLMCTDGVSDHLSPQTMTAGLSSAGAERAAEALVHAALKEGANDNTTALVVGVGPSTAPRSTGVMVKFERVRAVPIFSHLVYNELIKVLSIAELKNFRKGANLVEQGRTDEEMFVVLEGDATVQVNGETVEKARAGYVVGEMGLFDEAPRSATVTATTDLTALAIRRKELFELMRHEPTLTLRLQWGVIQQLARKLRARSGALADLKANQRTLEIPLPPSPEEL